MISRVLLLVLASYLRDPVVRDLCFTLSLSTHSNTAPITTRDSMCEILLRCEDFKIHRTGISVALRVDFPALPKMSITVLMHDSVS